MLITVFPALHLLGMSVCAGSKQCFVKRGVWVAYENKGCTHCVCSLAQPAGLQKLSYWFSQEQYTVYFHRGIWHWCFDDLSLQITSEKVTNPIVLSCK